MNGAESLARTLVAGGVDTCFANPGTSEMHFVAALDRIEGIRCVLGLFEGVVTGAADGYGRMKDKPAGTLLHLGPGLANGLANLHNASKAGTPIVNIVGDHATYHKQYNSPLTSDVEAVAKPFSAWIRTSPNAGAVAADAAAAIAAARVAPGQIATLILPGDAAWSEGSTPAPAPVLAPTPKVSADAVRNAAAVLKKGEPTVIVLGGHGMRANALELAGRIVAKTGVKMMGEAHSARIERGAGRVAVERISSGTDAAIKSLASFKHVILVGAQPPAAFFAAPGKPGLLAPKDAQVHVLADRGDDIVHALAWLADEIGAKDAKPNLTPASRPDPATGPISPEKLGISIGALLPDHAIVVDESITTGRSFAKPTQGAPQHDWLNSVGGSIGFAMPSAIGAALACPDRRVVCLESDGSGMYTLQALWTQARENLNITTVIFSNRSYQILRGVLAEVGAGQNVGPRALSMLDLSRPDLDWVSMAKGMGVPAVRAENMDDFNKHFAAGVKTAGPRLIEVVL